MRKLEELTFDNTYARLPEGFYERVQPTPFPNPHLVSFNPSAAVLIDLRIVDTCLGSRHDGSV